MWCNDWLNMTSPAMLLHPIGPWARRSPVVQTARSVDRARAVGRASSHRRRQWPGRPHRCRARWQRGNRRNRIGKSDRDPQAQHRRRDSQQQQRRPHGGSDRGAKRRKDRPRGRVAVYDRVDGFPRIESAAREVVTAQQRSGHLAGGAGTGTRRAGEGATRAGVQVGSNGLPVKNVPPNARLANWWLCRSANPQTGGGCTWVPRPRSECSRR